MKRGSLADMIFYGDGSTLVEEGFHTFHVTLKRSQVQGSSAFFILNIQIY